MCELSALTTDAKGCLFATGSVDGTTVIWIVGEDNNSVPHGACRGQTNEITSVVFLDPLPFLATADSGGNIWIWDILPKFADKTVAFKWKNEVTTYYVKCVYAYKEKCRVCSYINILPLCLELSIIEQLRMCCNGATMATLYIYYGIS